MVADEKVISALLQNPDVKRAAQALEITPQFINPPVIWSYSDPSSVNLKPGDDRLTCVFTALKPTGKNELSVKCYDTEIVIPVYLWER